MTNVTNTCESIYPRRRRRRKLYCSPPSLAAVLTVIFLGVGTSPRFDTTFTASGHVYTNSFPDFDEYDFSVLDPNHAYGTPFGGFSRATRSRLAALPLFLPDWLEEEPPDDPLHMEVRDAEGRLFVCRVYHEDELDPASLEESLFNMPKLRTEANHAQVTPHQPSMSSEGVSQKQLLRENLFHDMGDRLLMGADQDASSVVIDQKEISERLFEMIEQIGNLEGICGQVHKGWWSYEVCVAQVVSQFHIEVDPVNQQLKIESITNLGTFKERIFLVDLKESSSSNEFAEDETELGRIIDVYDDGTICAESKRPRKTYVQMQCCSKKVIARRQGMIHKDGKQLTSDIAAVLEVEEDPDQVCTYNVTMCTPLLCASDALQSSSSETPLKSQSVLTKSSPNVNETIIEILDRSFKDFKEGCLKSAIGGWWTYELCYKSKIRQYHETMGIRRNEAGTSYTTKQIEAEHILGKYDPTNAESNSKPWGEEWSTVVNNTAKHVEGSGTYYEMEYSAGDYCDHTDVTDSAIVAGTTGSGLVARSSSVRFFCGPKVDIAVNEDSTCHYIVEVSVPDLCAHPLFHEPMSKRQIVKCLPS